MNTKPAAHDAQRVEFAQEEGNHQGGLKRSDAAASFINTDHASSDFDDVGVLDRRDAQRAEQLNRCADIKLRE